MYQENLKLSIGFAVFLVAGSEKACMLPCSSPCRRNTARDGSLATCLHDDAAYLPN